MAKDEAPENTTEARPAVSLERLLSETRAACDGPYQAEIQALVGLSAMEIGALLPWIRNLDMFEALVAVVMEASRRDCGRARLRAKIVTLGPEAVAIARLIPSLVVLLDED